MNSKTNDRRGFLHGMLAAGGLAAAAPVAAEAHGGPAEARATSRFLPAYTRAQNYKSLKQSSYDRTGGNQRLVADRARRSAGGLQRHRTRRDHPHLVHHRRAENDHLKELVLRGYWDGNPKPSVEAPIGDFFGLNLGDLPGVPIAIPGVLAGTLAELLFRHAVQAVGAFHGDERRRASRWGLSIRISTT